MNRAILGLSVRAFVAAALILVTLMGLAAMWLFGWGFFQRETAGFRGETRVVEQVSADAGYRIAAYESFFDLCAAVQTKEAELAAAKSELDLHEQDSWRHGQLLANITAITSARAELINQYNADAAKADTAANFRSSDLPHQLDLETETTSCTAE